MPARITTKTRRTTPHAILFPFFASAKINDYFAQFSSRANKRRDMSWEGCVVAAFLVFLSVGVDPVYSQTPTWYPITPATPNTEFRFGHQACFSVNGTKKLVVYGGEDESYSYVQETDFFGYCTCCIFKTFPCS